MSVFGTNSPGFSWIKGHITGYCYNTLEIKLKTTHRVHTIGGRSYEARGACASPEFLLPNAVKCQVDAFCGIKNILKIFQLGLCSRPHWVSLHHFPDPISGGVPKNPTPCLGPLGLAPPCLRTFDYLPPPLVETCSDFTCTAIWPVLISHPADDRKLKCGWLVTYHDSIPLQSALINDHGNVQ